MRRRLRFSTTTALVLCVVASACSRQSNPLETSATQPPAKLRGAVKPVGSSSSSSVATDSTTTTQPAVPMWPLTGQLLDDPKLADHPAVVVKIDNHPDARPHMGLRKADIVYELKVEGITRFFSIFQSEDADPVGPVRSARSSDIDLFGELNKPYLMWSGGNPGVTGQVKEAERLGFVADVSDDVAQKDYFRDNSRQAPHNLYGHMSAIRQDYWLMAGKEPAPIFPYRNTDEPPASTSVDAFGMTVDFGSNVKVNWIWDAERQGWDRFQVDQSHPVGRDQFMDAAGGQVAPQNVVILFTPYGQSEVDARSPKALTVGEGDAYVLTLGKAYHAHWHRDAAIAAPVITDADGNQIGLTPGKTWVELPEAGGPGPVPLSQGEAQQYLGRRA